MERDRQLLATRLSARAFRIVALSATALGAASVAVTLSHGADTLDADDANALVPENLAFVDLDGESPEQPLPVDSESDGALVSGPGQNALDSGSGGTSDSPSVSSPADQNTTSTTTNGLAPTTSSLPPGVLPATTGSLPGTVSTSNPTSPATPETNPPVVEATTPNTTADLPNPSGGATPARQLVGFDPGSTIDQTVTAAPLRDANGQWDDLYAAIHVTPASISSIATGGSGTTANPWIIERYRIDLSNVTAPGGSVVIGIWIDGVDNVVVRNNVLNARARQLNASGNYNYPNNQSGPNLASGIHRAIEVRSSRNVVVERNDIVNWGQGILAWDPQWQQKVRNVTIQRNYLHNTGINWIAIKSGVGAVVKANWLEEPAGYVSDQEDGINVDDFDNAVIDNNLLLEGGVWSNGTGILLADSKGNNNVASRNLIYNPGRVPGNIAGGNNNEFRDNTVVISEAGATKFDWVSRAFGVINYGGNPCSSPTITDNWFWTEISTSELLATGTNSPCGQISGVGSDYPLVQPIGAETNHFNEGAKPTKAQLIANWNPLG